MIAILIATGRNANYLGLNEFLPSPLIPLGDRPFLQHTIETLARQNVRDFEFVLGHLPEKIESAFGDGSRWGCNFRYHLLPEGGDALRTAHNIAAASNEPILLVDAETLPCVELAGIRNKTLILANGCWTGWGCLSAPDLLSPALNWLDRLELPNGFDFLPVELCLGIRDGEEFLASQQQLLDESFPGLMISGTKADPGVWISRNVSLHPAAKIAPPVFIGENCRIERGALIGPCAVIGANCIVDSQTTVARSMVAPGSYIGEGLELESVIVDRNRLLNVRLGAFFPASETFLLGSLNERVSGRWFQKLLSRLAALLLLVFLWPLLLLTAAYLLLAGRGSLVASETVDLPAGGSPEAWRLVRVLSFRLKHPRGSRAAGFFCRFLPGLLSVVGGRLYLVGVAPRSIREIQALPSDWRTLYLNTKAGLITESEVMFGPNPTEDELYTAEAFYSATGSFRHDCGLAWLWLLQLLGASRRAGIDMAEDSH